MDAKKYFIEVSDAELRSKRLAFLQLGIKKKRLCLSSMAAFFMAIAGVSVVPPAFSQQLSTEQAEALLAADELAKGGAPLLAIRRLEVLRPSLNTAPLLWLRWERRHIQILEVEEQWQKIIARLSRANIRWPAAAEPWRSEQLALAQLQAGQPRNTVATLNQLITARPSGANRGLWELQRVRALMQLREYSQARQRAADWLNAAKKTAEPIASNKWDPLVDSWQAKNGIQRYRLDFSQPLPSRAEKTGRSEEFFELYAAALLQNDEPLEAAKQLDGFLSTRAKVLRLFAELQAESVAPPLALERALSLAADGSASQRTQRNAWLLAADAARQLGDAVIEAQSLEQGLLISAKTEIEDDLFVVNADSLWDAYARLAEQLAADLNLPRAVNDDWFIAAAKLRDESPLQSRALISKIAFDADSASDREIAHRQLAGWITAKSETGDLLRSLYLDSRRYVSEEAVPKPVLYALAGLALDEQNEQLASRLMALLQTAPVGTRQVDWLLQRAQASLLSGKAKQGIADVEAAFSGDSASGPNGGSGSGPGIGPGIGLDRYEDALAILFDLQTIGRHIEAERFFARLQTLKLNPQQRRELWFWRAESAKALKKPEDAAMMYLRSATALGPFAMDPWAQTARFNAAESLEEAGLLLDAKNLYTALLNVTEEPGRAALLRYKLQQIKIKSSNQT